MHYLRIRLRPRNFFLTKNNSPELFEWQLLKMQHIDSKNLNL